MSEADEKGEGAEIIPLRPDAGDPLHPAGGKAGADRATCPMCGKAAAEAYRPFCSKRCADLDLGQWLSEGYRVAGEEPASLGDEDEDA